MWLKIDKWVTKNIAWVLIMVMILINSSAVFSGWDKENIALLSMINSFAMGTVLAYIAHQQWQINITKVNLDLYDKRYKVYQDFQSFFKSFIFKNDNDSDADTNIVSDFVYLTDDLDFLFNDDVIKYRQELKMQADNYIWIKTKVEDYEARWCGGNQEDEVRNQINDHKERMAESALILYQTSDKCKMVFMPYLNFSKIS